MIVEQAKVGRRMKHSIPVSLPVKKYLEQWYPDQYLVCKDEYLGMWCINSLVRKTMDVAIFTEKDSDLRYLKSKEMTEKWSFLMPVRYNDRVKMPKTRVMEFQNMIMKCIDKEILEEMEMRRLRGDVHYIQTTINSFRDRYGIRDNNLEDERIRKMYLRFRDRQPLVQSQPLSFMPGMFFGRI